jgi:hypothetical protein
MKLIDRGVEPKILTQNSSFWTADYVAAAVEGNGGSKERWRHDDIRHALLRDSRQKCMYCESRVADVGFPNVEHVLPKSRFPEDAHRWSHLGLACVVCNVAKGDYWSSTEPVIDPYTEDPADYLVFHGDFVTAITGSVRGRVSRIKLDLQRPALVASRLARLEAVLKALEEWDVATGPLKKMLADEIERDVDEGEYSASVYSVLERLGFPFSSTREA